MRVACCRREDLGCQGEAEPVGDPLAAGAGQQAGALQADAGVIVAGMRSEKYFRVSDAPAPAPVRVAVLRLCSSSTMTRLARVSRATPQTERVKNPTDEASQRAVFIDKERTSLSQDNCGSGSVDTGFI
jgi:hypothetical protein